MSIDSHNNRGALMICKEYHINNVIVGVVSIWTGSSNILFMGGLIRHRMYINLDFNMARALCCITILTHLKYVCILLE